MKKKQYKMYDRSQVAIGEILEENSEYFILLIVESNLQNWSVGVRVKFDYGCAKTPKDVLAYHGWKEDEEAIPSMDPNGQSCEKCKLYYSFAQPNTPRHTYICFNCRN